MKFSWGKGIIVVCFLFISGILFMVYTTMTKNTDLVSKNYYDEELKYQQKIDRINSTANLKQKLKISLTHENITISYPETGSDITGEVSFYRPSDAGYDFKIPIAVSNGIQNISLANLQKGMWTIQVTWNSGGKGYYSEEKLMIQ